MAAKYIAICMKQAKVFPFRVQILRLVPFLRLFQKRIHRILLKDKNKVFTSCWSYGKIESKVKLWFCL